MKGKLINKCKKCGNSYFGKACDVRTGRSKYCGLHCRKTSRIVPIIDRFWKKVNKTGDCWLWTASVNEKGYGIFDADCGFKGAHRYSYFLHFGEIPKNMLVCHKCDNPKCVNPSHLFIGTIADNNKDKINKNRQAKGSNTNRTKLDESQIPIIRDLLANKIPSRKIGNMFNVTHSTIRAIKTRITWAHVR